MKHIRLRLLVASAFTLLVAACSQAPVPQSQAKTPLVPQFGTQRYDSAEQIVASGNLNAIFVAGTTSGSALKLDTNENDIYLRRYKRGGALEWGLQFGDVGYNVLSGITLDSHNHVYVAGYAEDGLSVTSAFLKQYTSDGKLNWSRQIEEAVKGNIFTTAVLVDATGDVFVVGGVRDGGRSFIKKYTNLGRLVWSKTYRGTFFGSAQIDNKGNLYIINPYTQLQKYDRTGKLVWERSAIPAANSYISGIKVVGNSLYISGSKYWTGNETYETDAYVAKFDLTGNRKWFKTFGTKSPDEASAITADSRGNVYVTGYTQGALVNTNSGVVDVIVRKYEPSGSVGWTQQFGSPVDDNGEAIIAFSPNELYVGGRTYGDLGAGNQGEFDAFLARLDGKGNRVWIR